MQATVSIKSKKFREIGIRGLNIRMILFDVETTVDEPRRSMSLVGHDRPHHQFIQAHRVIRSRPSIYRQMSLGDPSPPRRMVF